MNKMYWSHGFHFQESLNHIEFLEKKYKDFSLATHITMCQRYNTIKLPMYIFMLLLSLGSFIAFGYCSLNILQILYKIYENLKTLPTFQNAYELVRYLNINNLSGDYFKIISLKYQAINLLGLGIFLTGLSFIAFIILTKINPNAELIELKNRLESLRNKASNNIITLTQVKNILTIKPIDSELPDLTLATKEEDLIEILEPQKFRIILNICNQHFIGKRRKMQQLYRIGAIAYKCKIIRTIQPLTLGAKINAWVKFIDAIKPNEYRKGISITSEDPFYYQNEEKSKMKDNYRIIIKLFFDYGLCEDAKYIEDELKKIH